MMKKKRARPEATTVTIGDPEQVTGKLTRVGGSRSDDWNNRIINDTTQALWIKNSDQKEYDRQIKAALSGLIGISPKDELEGMMAAQLIASHSAAMECYRRAMIGEQTFEGRRENLNHANKLSRTFTMLLDALNRHRGKGQQQVRVEHVHIHQGGQAVVGLVRGVGLHRKRRINPLHPGPSRMNQARRCRAKSKRSGKPCQAPAVRGWAVCRMHGAGGGAPKGNKNALRHGFYTATAIAMRKAIRALLRESRELAQCV